MRLRSRGALLRELIGLALQKERSVDEGLVVQPQRLLDQVLGGAHAALGERFPFAVFGLDVEFEDGGSIAPLAAQHPVGCCSRR